MSSPTTRRILYIEDDLANRQLIQFIIDRRDDLELFLAENGKTGIQIAKEMVPDLILLDLSLPDITGFEVFNQLKNTDQTGNIPVIAVSGDSLPQDVERGLQAGFTNYLGKPIQVAELYKAIDDSFI